MQQLPFSMQETKNSGKNEPQTNIFVRKELFKGFPNRLPSLEFSDLSSVDISSLLPLVWIKKCFDLASICLKYETQWQQAHIQTQKYNFLIEIKIAKEYLSMREQRSARRRKIVYFAMATQLPLPIPFFRPSYSSIQQRMISCRGVQFQKIIDCPIPFTPLIKGAEEDLFALLIGNGVLHGLFINHCSFLDFICE